MWTLAAAAATACDTSEAGRSGPTAWAWGRARARAWGLGRACFYLSRLCLLSGLCFRMKQSRAAALFALVAFAAAASPSWHRQQLGRVTHARLFGSHAYVATAEGVLASLNASSGDLGAQPPPARPPASPHAARAEWRQLVAEPGALGEALFAKRVIVTASEDGGVQLLQGWASKARSPAPPLPRAHARAGRRPGVAARAGRRARRAAAPRLWRGGERGAAGRRQRAGAAQPRPPHTLRSRAHAPQLLSASDGSVAWERVLPLGGANLSACVPLPRLRRG